MGATFQEARVKACSEADLMKEWNEIFDLSRAENGYDNYSGEFATKREGLEITCKHFPDHDRAMDYLADAADKRKPALAVKVKVPTPSVTKKIESIKAKIGELAQVSGAALSTTAVAEQNIYKASVERTQLANAKLKGCKTCGSQIAKEHIKSHRCPVCHDPDFVLVQADRNKLNTIKTMREKAKAKIADHENQILKLAAEDKSTDYYWLIGADCPS
jgi:Zn finger protein HypA/HybF involved in hydrogenase expression